MISNIKDSVILDKKQKEFIFLFAVHPLKDEFYLSGGTALAAFYLQHRYSEDLDFFCERDFRVEPVLEFLHQLPGIVKVDYDSKFDRKLFLLQFEHNQILKVEFTKYPFSRIQPGLKVEGINIDSLEDILINKLLAMTDRKDPKDYFDIYCILKSNPVFKIKAAVEKAEKKFGISGVKYVLQSKLLADIDLSGIRALEPFSLKDVLDYLKGLVYELV